MEKERKKSKKTLIAVSGGPDSMFLLNKYKNKKNILVATVNYNQREDSELDFKIVKVFCQKYNIPLFCLELKKSDYLKGNFQNWAREQRYTFLKKIYKENNCNVLLTGHNLDDFLETAIFQKNTKRKVEYYGIKKISNYKNMVIKRPLLFKYFKNTILKKVIKQRIPFNIDYTNEIPKYTRNKIRLENNVKWKSKKIFILSYFIFQNQKLKFKNYKINKEYKIWEKHDFSQDIFIKLKNKKSLVYKFVNSNYDKIKISNNKIDSIINFIMAQKRTNSYKLNNEFFLKKEKGNLIKIK